MARGQLLTQSEVAAKLGKSRDKIARWTELGLLPTFTDPDSGRVMYPIAAVDRWLEHPKAS
jgi:predicted DNA-binding transcriptional regulator AlpA